jgi:hypothetical protein
MSSWDQWWAALMSMLVNDKVSGISHCQQSMRRGHYINTKIREARIYGLWLCIRRADGYEENLNMGVLVLATVRAFKEPEQHSGHNNGPVEI